MAKLKRPMSRNDYGARVREIASNLSRELTALPEHDEITIDQCFDMGICPGDCLDLIIMDHTDKYDDER